METRTSKTYNLFELFHLWKRKDNLILALVHQDKIVWRLSPEYAIKEIKLKKDLKTPTNDKRV